jgi:hypothetical protein
LSSVVLVALPTRSATANARIWMTGARRASPGRPRRARAARRGRSARRRSGHGGERQPRALQQHALQPAVRWSRRNRRPRERGRRCPGWSAAACRR